MKIGRSVAFFIGMIFSGEASANEARTWSADMQIEDSKTARACAALGPGFHAVDRSRLCFNGFIIDFTVAPLIKAIDALADKLDVRPVLIINSIGGEVHAAMDVGRALDRKNVRLVVSEQCVSSCANYIFSAAPSVGVLPNSLVLLHGSLHRNRNDFAYVELIGKGVTRDELNKDMQPYYDAWDRYAEYARDDLKRENDFFIDVQLDEQYLHRYVSVYENSTLHQGIKCQRKKGIILAISPEYFSRYRPESIDYFWFPTFDETGEALKTYPDLKETYDFYFGDELHPRWVVETGLVSPDDCSDDLARQPR